VKDLTFITGNQNKADFLAKWLGIGLPHQKVELDELQALDLHEIAEHKARQAYDIVQKPVLVEDVSLTFHAFGKLPGPFIKWFLQELDHQQVCDLLAKFDNRGATAGVSYCVYDGSGVRFFDGSVEGTITTSPRGNGGFGFDPIFIPDGSEHTYAEMDNAELAKFALRPTTVFPQLREFLTSRPKSL
jgi:non-canonical purine NTP pyrophosphatase (RdgB/HAM1 family)